MAQQGVDSGHKSFDPFFKRLNPLGRGVLAIGHCLSPSIRRSLGVRISSCQCRRRAVSRETTVPELWIFAVCGLQTR